MKKCVLLAVLMASALQTQQQNTNKLRRGNFNLVEYFRHKKVKNAQQRRKTQLITTSLENKLYLFRVVVWSKNYII